MGQTKLLIISLLATSLLTSCGGKTTYNTGPSYEYGPVSISATVNNDGEIQLSGKLSSAPYPLVYKGVYLGSVSWDVGFETTWNQAKEKQNALFVLFEDNGNIVQQEYDIGKPFEIDFANDQWVRKIKSDGNGNVVVFVEKRVVSQVIVITATPNTPSSNLPPQSTTVSHQSTNGNNYSFATISCADDITQVSLRKSPGYVNKDDEDVIYKIDCGEKVQLLGDKKKADGLTWWHVSWNSYTGWIADHTGTGRTILIFNQ